VTLRGKLVLYVVLLHALMAGTAILALWDRRAWLLAAEAIFALSIVVAVRLVRAFFVPLELIGTGAELIGERDFTTRFQPVGQPEMDRLIEVYNRMIDQLREERLKVREQDQLFDRIVETSPGGVVIADFDGRITDLNRSAERLLRWSREAVIGRLPQEIEGAAAHFLAALEVGSAGLLSTGGGRRIKVRRAAFRDRGFARGFFLLEELTEELRRTERAAYGKLVRMVSHEVNNSVGVVSSVLDTLRHEVTPRQPAGEGTERAISLASDRLESLRAFVDRFADVVRLPAPDRRPCDLDALLADVVGLHERALAGRGIRCTWGARTQPAIVDLDKNQIEQVVINLLKNAAESIDREGSITVSTGLEEGVPWLTIDDTGPGIAEEARSELFTPFFTTKREGCGLGLTLVKEVLTRHGFGFSLESTPEGACFTIRFGDPPGRSG
jgi:signal transduction histidine kinase